MTTDEREMLLENPAVLELLREEREACARLAENFAQAPSLYPDGRCRTAVAIRSRTAAALRFAPGAP